MVLGNKSLLMAELERACFGHERAIERAVHCSLIEIRGSVENSRRSLFIGHDGIERWADRLGLTIVSIIGGNEPFIFLQYPVKLDNGGIIEGLQAFGQSVCLLKA
ncbi:hypothetical protein BCL69_11272 [Nitrosomonas communis]|uniref:Uncharacterized protein n=2 Tax=Nitrosomonas TaxID=914 RepID=A0A0F7KG67_9PROT|nr:hypothetical protein [Nitrosomonas communis]AKH38426.1 hypothetical protein AAW31_12445 [Nitrosomonas communis]TYP70400.1 hypothetical protein BCL69_11272 [Nitrosomonas communis]